ncbi:MAG TPA: 4-hydroxy-tetrahydrodipicolinate synthase [Planctomycetota bacterium]|nr:4-hydroxy-tetrahydrodipicolinate synthase [Planctomycetota bacterium]
MPQFSGSIVAIVTPFIDDKVDFASLRKLIDWHIAEGTQGIVPCGTTGESSTFTHEEQHQVIGEVVQHVRGRAFVIAGAGSNNTKEAVSLGKAAERLGADGILTITPYYNKPTPEGLFQHFKAVRENTRLPMVLYNVPGRTGVNMLADTVARVAELGNVDSVKEASGSCDQVHELIARGVRVLSGDDGMTLPFMALGAAGVISVVANFAPRLMRSLTDAMAKGDLVGARKAHAIVLELAKHAFSETNPIPAKTAVASLGFCRDEFRLPLVKMTPGKKEALLAALKQYGLTK